MRLVESFLTKNPCYTAGRKITVKGLMLHSVGCPQPRAQFILESGYGRKELAQKANNCFGMKCVLSGNSWGGSA